jgi:hypothetical protein
LELLPRHRVDAEANRVHDKLGIGVGQRLGSGARIALARLLAVAHNQDDTLGRFFACEVLCREL